MQIDSKICNIRVCQLKESTICTASERVFVFDKILLEQISQFKTSQGMIRKDCSYHVKEIPNLPSRPLFNPHKHCDGDEASYTSSTKHEKALLFAASSWGSFPCIFGQLFDHVHLVPLSHNICFFVTAIKCTSKEAIFHFFDTSVGARLK